MIACCTHPVFSMDASVRLEGSCISKVVSLDTIPIPESKQFEKLTTLSVAPLLADAIRQIYLNESVRELFHDWR